MGVMASSWRERYSVQQVLNELNENSDQESESDDNNDDGLHDDSEDREAENISNAGSQPDDAESRSTGRVFCMHIM